MARSVVPILLRAPSRNLSQLLERCALRVVEYLDICAERNYGGGAGWPPPLSPAKRRDGVVPGQLMRYQVPDPGVSGHRVAASGLWLMRLAAVTGSTACDAAQSWTSRSGRPGSSPAVGARVAMSMRSLNSPYRA